MSGEGADKPADALEPFTRLEPLRERASAPTPVESAPMPSEAAQPAAPLDAGLPETRCEPASIDSSEAIWREEALQPFGGLDGLPYWTRVGPDELRAISWIDRRLDELGRRLERRLCLDQELRRITDSAWPGYRQPDELQRQELSARLVDEVRSGFSALARDEMRPLQAKATATFLDDPLIRLCSLDSSSRHPRESDTPGVDSPLGDGATSLTVVRTTRSPIPRLVESLAEWGSSAVPGELDFKASITYRRARIGATYRPWASVDAPLLLRGVTIRASRAYEDYLGDSEVVDRIDCGMALFAGPRSRGGLLLEHEHGDRESVTRFAFSLVCQF